MAKEIIRKVRSDAGDGTYLETEIYADGTQTTFKYTPLYEGLQGNTLSLSDFSQSLSEIEPNNLLLSADSIIVNERQPGKSYKPGDLVRFKMQSDGRFIAL